MFNPTYTITSSLLQNIADISRIVTELNFKKFSQPILVNLEKKALEISIYSSTSIEGNPLPLTEVRKLLKSAPKNARDSEKEILNYNSALMFLSAKMKADEKPHLDNRLILKIQKMVTSGLLEKHRNGKFRKEHVVVHDPRTRDIAYIPPDYKDVPKLMKELVAFVNNAHREVHPVLLAGLFHKAFVIIHPFSDGNGRTTRLMSTFLLAEMGLNTFNLFSFEQYYNKNVTKYFTTVGEYGDYYELVHQIDYTAWLEYFTAGIIDELMRVQKDMEKEFPSHIPPLLEHEQEIMRYIEQFSQIRDREYATLTARARSTRALDFKKLIERGLIQRKGKGKNSFYIMREQ